jgi:DNA repair protein RadA/Sms
LPQHICFAGEVGLSGEIRAVNRIDQRIAEAEKLGFEKIIVSKYNQKGLAKQKFNIKIVTMGTGGRVVQIFILSNLIDHLKK